GLRTSSVWRETPLSQVPPICSARSVYMGASLRSRSAVAGMNDLAPFRGGFTTTHACFYASRAQRSAVFLLRDIVNQSLWTQYRGGPVVAAMLATSRKLQRPGGVRCLAGTLRERNRHPPAPTTPVTQAALAPLRSCLNGSDRAALHPR